jgi:hypothetical protein
MEKSDKWKLRVHLKDRKAGYPVRQRTIIASTKNEAIEQLKIFRYDLGLPEPEDGQGHYQIVVRTDGKRYTKCFSVNACGSRRAAFYEALKHRNWLLEQLNIPITKQMVTTRPHRPKNRPHSTGIVCVHRVHVKRNKKLYYYYKADWLEGQKRKTKFFSVRRYGENGALSLAIARRQGYEMNVYKC